MLQPLYLGQHGKACRLHGICKMLSGGGQHVVGQRHACAGAQSLQPAGSYFPDDFGRIALEATAAAFFIISNTVRVTMYNRRLEIRIMKSVGATKWFIRWPFMVEGIVLGIISGLISLGIVFGLYKLAANAVGNILGVLSVEPVPFENYVLGILIAFVATGVVTGAFGSIVSMNKYLKEQDYDSDNVSE